MRPDPLPRQPNGLDPVISIRGVHKSFGELEVLRGVDLDVYPAENVVVLGRSGQLGRPAGAGLSAAYAVFVALVATRL